MWVLGLLASLGAAFAACGIDESGLMADAADDAVTLLDAGSKDASGGDSLPPVCSSLDASCLGTTLPAGWEPFAMQVDASAVTCPGDGGDFGEVSYAANPVVVGSSCVCTPCSVATGWNCSGSLGANGSGCNGQTKAVGGGPYCWSVTGTSGTGSVTRTGVATCAASTYYATTATATDVAGCAPKRCESDFCGLATSGLKLCARNAAVSDGGCPKGLPVPFIVGTNPHAACNACPTCTVSNPTAACSATLSGYTSGDCTTGLFGSAAADGTCIGNVSFNSVLYTPTVPTPICAPTGPTNVGGTGEVDSPLTVCCLN